MTLHNFRGKNMSAWTEVDCCICIFSSGGRLCLLFRGHRCRFYIFLHPSFLVYLSLFRSRLFCPPFFRDGFCLPLCTRGCRFYVNFANAAHCGRFFCLHFAAASVYHFSRQLLRLFPRQLRTTPLFWRPPLSCLFGHQSCGTRTLGWAGQTRPHRNPFSGPLHPG